MTDLNIATSALITFVLVDNTGTEVTGLAGALTVAISKNGGAFAAGTGAKAEIGTGWYSYTLSAAETNTAGPLAVTVSGAGTVQQNLTYQVVGYVVTSVSGPDYCTLAQIKALVRTTSVDAADDAVIEDMITQASRTFDGETGRRFYTTALDETRVYSPRDGDIVFTDDIISITTLKTDNDADRTYEIPWATTDYDTMPENASLNGTPIVWLTLAPNGRYVFPVGPRTVEIVGEFGWAAVAPADVTFAVEEIVVNAYKRRFGENTEGAATITAAGVVITPKDIPASAWKTIQRYRRLS